MFAGNGEVDLRLESGDAFATPLAGGLLLTVVPFTRCCWLSLLVIVIGYLRPPVANRVSPVSHAESDETRKVATRAMSSGWPMRPRGLFSVACFSKSLPESPAAWKPSVSTGPGLMALTLIFFGPNSLASTWVTASTEALVAA